MIARKWSRNAPLLKSALTALFFLFPIFSYAAIDQTLAISLPNTFITQAQGMMIEQLLLQKRYNDTLSYIDDELAKNPNNTELLYKKAAVYVEMEQYGNASDTLDEILKLQPEHKEAASLRARITELEKSIVHNELGASFNDAYVSDQNSYWTYSSLHYYRFTDFGTYGGRVNYATRYGTNAEQYQFEAYPKFQNSWHIQYIQMSFAYSNFSQILFPNYQYSFEPYFNLPHNFELSAGFRGLDSFGVGIYTYTGSLGYYFGNNYAWFRPYIYAPEPAQFYEIGIRHYFSNKNTFVSLKAGKGKAPDILDLAPLNQIIILDQDLIAGNAQFLIYKNVYLQVGAGYLHQVFPSGNVRNITDGSLGAIWQF